MSKEKIVISVGGSLIVPEEIDISFIHSFRDLIRKHIPNKQFYIITGGGKICRKYQQALTALRDVESNDLDWMGIYITHLNAEFLKLVFTEEEADKDIITSEDTVKTSQYPLVFGGGWEPGSSTDLRAVQIAAKVGASLIINLTNVDYAYDSDPRTNPHAKKLEDITWEEYRKLIPQNWDPGLSTPFDPIASKEAEMYGIEVIIMGNNMDNLDKCLNKEAFQGTLIHP